MCSPGGSVNLCQRLFFRRPSAVERMYPSQQLPRKKVVTLSYRPDRQDGLPAFSCAVGPQTRSVLGLLPTHAILRVAGSMIRK